MLNSIIKSWMDLEVLRHSIIEIYAADPRRVRIANAAVESFHNPAVQAAFARFLELWNREAKVAYRK